MQIVEINYKINRQQAKYTSNTAEVFTTAVSGLVFSSHVCNQ